MATAGTALVHNSRPRTPLDVFMGKVISIEDREEIKRALPAHVPYARFERNLINALMNEPRLLNCDPRMVLREVMKIAALGLLIDAQLGEAYLIAGGKGPQSRIGYRGLIKLARQSGQVAKIYAHEVCANDKVAGKLGTNKFLEHEPDFFGDRGDVIGFYAVIVFKDGETDFEAMNSAQVNAIRDKSDGWKAYRNGSIKDTPWNSSYDEMGKKTVIRRLIKRSPQSPDLVQAFQVEDEADSSELVPSMTRALPMRNPLADEDDAGQAVQQQSVTDHQDQVDPETGEITGGEPPTEVGDASHDDADRERTKVAASDPNARAAEAKVAAQQEEPAKTRAPRGAKAAEKREREAAAGEAAAKPADPATAEDVIAVFTAGCAAVKTDDELERLRVKHRPALGKLTQEQFRKAERAYVGAKDRIAAEIAAAQVKESEGRADGHADQSSEQAGEEAAEAAEASDRGLPAGGGDSAAGQGSPQGSAPAPEGEARQISSGANDRVETPAAPAESWEILVPAGEWPDRELKVLKNTAKGLFKAETLSEVRDVADSYREVIKLKSDEVQEAWAAMIKAREDALKAGARKA